MKSEDYLIQVIRIDGVVKEIKNATVVVEENIMDIFGESKQRTINLRLRQEKE